jgi:two-component system sensor histidine kinase KdpD
MRTGRGPIGVIGIDDDKTGPLLTPDQRRLLDALMDQGALAIERVLLVEDMDRVKRTVESDRLRSALLTSISHDLKRRWLRCLARPARCAISTAA